METEGLLAALRQLLRSAAAPQQPGFGSMLQPAQQGHSSRNHDPQTHQAAGTSAVPAWDAQVCAPPEPEAGLQQLVCNVNPKSVVSSKDAFFLLRVLGLVLRSGNFRSHSISAFFLACDFFQSKTALPCLLLRFHMYQGYFQTPGHHCGAAHCCSKAEQWLLAQACLPASSSSAPRTHFSTCIEAAFLLVRAWKSLLASLLKSTTALKETKKNNQQTTQQTNPSFNCRLTTGEKKERGALLGLANFLLPFPESK